MTDVTLDRYLTWGTAADRAAFTPVPGVGGTGTNILPIWVDSDVGGNPAWLWDTATTAWIPWATGGGSGRTIFQYKAKVSATSGYPGDGYMLWNNATQTSATSLLFAHITDDGIDVDLFLAFIASGDTIIVQDADSSTDYQKWAVSGSPTNTNAGTGTSYWTVPVTLTTSGGTGTTGFTANTRLIAAVFPAASAGGITQLTGDVTAGPGSGSQAATIANNAVTTAKINNSAVTLAKIANQADLTILGNNSGGAGPPIALTVAQTKTVLGLGTAATQNTGTSGANVPLMNGGNTWSGLQTLSSGGDLTPAATPSTTAIGYLGAPQNILAGSYTTVMADAGKHFYHTSGSAHTLTIDSNANVPYPIGTVMAGVNENGAGVLTIAITSDTLRWGSSTGSRSVAANGSFSLLKVTSTVWRLTGDGIT